MSKGRSVRRKKSSITDFSATIETFSPPTAYDLESMKEGKPSVWNGKVAIKKYRVTVEIIEEPKEVIEQRLQDLWDVCNNHHSVEPLREAAKLIGYELKGTPGSKVAPSSW